MSDQIALLDLTAEIVSAFVSNNSARAVDLPEIISTVHTALTRITAPKEEPAQAEPLTPAVSVKKSVTDDYIVSLEDGRKFKSMKRYLAGLGMTPDQYRAKWNLPRDYPMVAPGYAAKRSELAKAVGLGRKPGVAASSPDAAASTPPGEAVSEPDADASEAVPAAEVSDASAKAPAKRRGRPSKKAA